MTYTPLTDSQLTDLLNRTKTIALVGASAKPERPSHEVMAYLLDHGFHVIPVNPGLAGQQILGQTVVATLGDIDEPVHMVDVFRQSSAVPAVVQDAIAIKADSIWMQEGVIHEEAAQEAKDAGMSVVMDLCTKKEYRRLIK